VTTVRAYWWNEQPNFGDAMNPVLLHRLFGVDVVWADLADADLTAAGSVIQWITPIQHRRREPLAVWGSGYIFADEPPPSADHVTFAAVRGARSAELSGLSPSVALGDPGLLASLAIEGPRHRRGIGFVPHLWHLRNPLLRRIIESVNGILIDVTADPLQTIERIAGCDFVFSTSLHGLVIADSFGIPNCWFTLDPPLFGGEWKFADYYSAFGMSVRPARIDGPDDVDALVDALSSRYDRPGLGALQQGLLNAYPFQ
jgi:pyruvyltransferase